jgi:hypothetical protein
MEEEEKYERQRSWSAGSGDESDNIKQHCHSQLPTYDYCN